MSQPTYSTINVNIREKYDDLIAAFNWCAKSELVHVVVLTGSPLSQPHEFYSSGNDLGNFSAPSPDMELPAMTRAAGEKCRLFVEAFIRFPKPLIAAVNGPAIGIAVTTTQLCDLVYTNEKATFTTPFTALGQNPEGCSSLLFPARLGQRANRLLLLGETLTAKEAERLNFTSGLFPNATFLEDVHKVAVKLANFPLHSVMASKQLIRRQLLESLLQANKDECKVLEDLLNSPETMEAVMNRMMQMKQPKSKL